MKVPEQTRLSNHCTILLVLMLAAALTIVPVSAGNTVTIVPRGTGTYHLGEMIVFTGANTGTDTTSLFLIGPNLPRSGAMLANAFEPVVSGDPRTFATAPVNKDHLWEYAWFTSHLGISEGIYTIYAVNRSKTHDELADAAYSATDITLEKPFITADIQPPLAAKGYPFTITGTAKGNPPYVQLWMFGDHYLAHGLVPVSPDSAYALTIDSLTARDLPEGQWYLVVQHPMDDHRFNVTLDGNWIRTTCSNGGGTIKIQGEGASHGSEAAMSLLANGFSPACNDDTYTVVPFVVDNKGITRGIMPGATAGRSMESSS